MSEKKTHKQWVVYTMDKDARIGQDSYVTQTRTHDNRDTTQVFTITHTGAIYNACRACGEMLISSSTWRYRPGGTIYTAQ